MKLWPASILSRRFALASSVLIALGTGISPMAVADTRVLPPAPNTVKALACLLGMKFTECDGYFVGATLNDVNNPHPTHLERRDVYNLIAHCFAGYVHDCSQGQLKTIRYFGTNASGADVYDVKFTHQEMTYIIAQHTPDRRIPALWISSGPPSSAASADLVKLQSPVMPARTIYSHKG